MHVYPRNINLLIYAPENKSSPSIVTGIWRVFLDLNKYIFPWQICFIWGVVLQWSCIEINTVLFKIKKRKDYEIMVFCGQCSRGYAACLTNGINSCTDE